MDVKKLDQVVAADEEGVVVTIYRPNGDPYLAADGTDSTMTVLGAESKRYRAAKRATIKRVLKRRSARRMEIEEVEANRISQAAAAVIAWHGWEDGATPLDCTTEHVSGVLVVEHILEQVENAIAGHADFFSAPSET